MPNWNLDCMPKGILYAWFLLCNLCIEVYTQLLTTDQELHAVPNRRDELRTEPGSLPHIERRGSWIQSPHFPKLNHWVGAASSWNPGDHIPVYVDFRISFRDSCRAFEPNQYHLKLLDNVNFTYVAVLKHALDGKKILGSDFYLDLRLKVR